MEVVVGGGGMAPLGGVGTRQGRMEVVVGGALGVDPTGVALALVHLAQGLRQVC